MSAIIVFAVAFFLGTMFGISIGRFYEMEHAYDPLREIANEVTEGLRRGEQFHLSVIMGRCDDDDGDDDGDEDDVVPKVGAGQRWEDQ